jgi:hypothetical protein
LSQVRTLLHESTDHLFQTLHLGTLLLALPPQLSHFRFQLYEKIKVSTPSSTSKGSMRAYLEDVFFLAVT